MYILSILLTLIIDTFKNIVELIINLDELLFRLNDDGEVNS